MTTLQYQGQTVNFTHPRELRNVLPPPPLQPLASYPVELTAFRTAITALSAATDGGTRRDSFREALGVLTVNHLQATIADCPGGTLPASLSAQLRGEYAELARVPGYFYPAAWF